MLRKLHWRKPAPTKEGQPLAERGFIVAPDITGYTDFLNDSELEHAEDSLRDLLDLIIEQTKPPPVISRPEGDAVISYAPEASFLQGQIMAKIFEGINVKFREARQRMRPTLPVLATHARTFLI